MPVELVAAEPERFGTALVRATGSAAYVAALEPLPDAPDEAAVYAALGVPWCPPELREAPFRGEPPALVELDDIRGDLHCHTTWSDGRASVEEMGRAARERGYEYLAICDHTPAVGAVQGLTPDDVRRQAEEIAAANEALAPFRVLRGIECDILPDGRLDLPDDVLAELDWVQASVHGGQRMPRPEMTKRVEEALRNPSVRCLSHPTGRLRSVQRTCNVALDSFAESANAGASFSVEESKLTIYAPPGSPNSVVTVATRYENFIGGEWVAPVKGQYFQNSTPVTGQVFTEIARSTSDDVELALDARARRQACVGEDVRGRSCVGVEQDRRPPAGEPGTAGHRRDLGQRKADPRDPGRGSAVGHRSLQIFRRRDPRLRRAASPRSTVTPSPITCTSHWALWHRSFRGTSRS